MWDMIKMLNFYKIRVLGEEIENTIEVIFKEIIGDNILNLMKILIYGFKKFSKI